MTCKYLFSKLSQELSASLTVFLLLGGLYKGTQAPQGAAGSAYDSMSAAKIKILADGNKIFNFYMNIMNA